MTVSDVQVRRLMEEKAKSGKSGLAAMRTGIAALDFASRCARCYARAERCPPNHQLATPGAAMRYRTEVTVLLVLDGLLFVGLGIRPKADRFTWLLENAPVILGVAALAIAWPRFKFTRLSTRLVFLHAIVLMVGGYYTYAEVPLGFWAQDAFHLSRNHYDRLGHLFQGFVPAIIVREFLLRQGPLKKGKLLFFLTTCVCLAISAFYELVEAWTSMAKGASADAFLGTQGDPWDSQNDMFMCLIGAVLAQLLLARLHDRSLARHAADVGANGESPGLAG